MSGQHKCRYCGSEMKVEPLKQGERETKHVEGKGNYLVYKCVNDKCGAKEEIFRSYKSE